MSFLDCLGKFMEGRCIEELWATVYGKSTIPYLLSGHAYTCSYRAHMMTQAALMTLILEEYPTLKEFAKYALEDIYCKVQTKEIHVEDEN